MLNPWMGTITLPLASTPYRLAVLLAASPTPPSTPTGTGWYACAQLAIQADPDGGGARFYVGNASLSATNAGVAFFSTQSWSIYAFMTNPIDLNSLYVMCDTGGLKMNVTFMRL